MFSCSKKRSFTSWAGFTCRGNMRLKTPGAGSRKTLRAGSGEGAGPGRDWGVSWVTSGLGPGPPLRVRCPPQLPPFPQPTRRPHSQAKLTFRGGGCISAPAKGSDSTPELEEAPPTPKPRPGPGPAPPPSRPRLVRLRAGLRSAKVPRRNQRNFCWCCGSPGKGRDRRVDAASAAL